MAWLEPEPQGKTRMKSYDWNIWDDHHKNLIGLRSYHEVIPCFDEEQWLKERRAYLTASQIPAAMGVHPYWSRLQLWAEKTGKREPEPCSNRLMQMGNHNEIMIAHWYEEEQPDHECLDLGPYTMVASKEFPRLACTPDFLVSRDGDHPDWVLEVKWTNYSAQYDEGPPEYVLAQVVAQMMITGYREAVVGAGFWHQIDRPGFFHTQWSEAYAEKVKAGIDEFLWYVDKDERPPASWADIDHLKEDWSPPIEASAAMSSALQDTSFGYWDCKDDMQSIKTMCDTTKAVVIEEMQAKGVNLLLWGDGEPAWKAVTVKAKPPKKPYVQIKAYRPKGD